MSAPDTNRRKKPLVRVRRSAIRHDGPRALPESASAGGLGSRAVSTRPAGFERRSGLSPVCSTRDRFFDFRPSDGSAYAKLLLPSPRSTDFKGQFATMSDWPKQLYNDAHEKYDSVVLCRR